MSEAVPETPEAESLERLGAELWQRRKQAGYSLSEVADAIRINQEPIDLQHPSLPIRPRSLQT